MRILVTGASGFVGAAVVRRALKAGHDVVAAVRPDADLWRLQGLQSLDSWGVSLYELGQDWIPTRTHFDAVIHCAWANDRLARDNSRLQLRSVEGTLALYRATIERGIRRFVAVGSQAEFGDTIYGMAKRTTRDLLELAQQRPTTITWARLYSVYGPGERRSDSLLARLVRHYLTKEGPFEVKSTGEHFWHYLYEDDAADALLDLAGRFDVAHEVDLPCAEEYAAKLGWYLDSAWELCFPSKPRPVYGSRKDPSLAMRAPYMPAKVSFREGVLRLHETMKGDPRALA